MRFWSDLGIGLCILKEVKNEACRLLRPAALRPLVCLTLCMTADATIEAAEGNRLLVLENILQEALCLLELQAADSTNSLASALYYV